MDRRGTAMSVGVFVMGEFPAFFMIAAMSTVSWVHSSGARLLQLYHMMT
jgi:hypothetical protein